jgi:uncharacterized protein (TIGR02996 family)
MHEQGAFLAAIAAHLDSDGPRLVYADWLEERGDARGEPLRRDGRWLLEGGRLAWATAGARFAVGEWPGAAPRCGSCRAGSPLWRLGGRWHCPVCLGGAVRLAAVALASLGWRFERAGRGLAELLRGAGRLAG